MDEKNTVSVVTPVYKAVKWLDTYFKALREVDTSQFSFQVIIIDNDPTSLSLEDYYAMAGELDLHVISNDENRGFGAACNQGVQAASGNYILFLNVDTEISPDAVLLMIKRLEREPGCAMVEARQLPEEHPKFYWPHSGRVDWCSGCCLLMRKNLFLESGGFDERFFLYCEDVDLSFRLTDRGYKLAYLPEATVRHLQTEDDRKADLFRTFHEIKSSVILRGRYLRTADFIASLWQQFLRVIGSGKYSKASFYKPVAAIKEGIKASAAVLMERWSSRTLFSYKIPWDRGEFSLHYRFEDLSSEERLELSEPVMKDFTVVVVSEDTGFQIDNLCESILSQLEELNSGQLLIVDYGSRVGSSEGLLERFKGRERMNVVRSPLKRWAVAIDTAVSKADGEFILFVKDSLIPHPSMIKAHVQAQSDSDFVTGKVLNVYPVTGAPFRKFMRDRHSLGANLRGQVNGKPEYINDTPFRNCSLKRTLFQDTQQLLKDYSMNLWSGRAAIEAYIDRLESQGLHTSLGERFVSLDSYIPSFRSFLARAFKYGFSIAAVEDSSTSLASSFVRQLMSFIFVVTPLSFPGILFECISPAQRQINPLAAWWYSYVEKVFFNGGRLWYHNFREYFL